MRAMKLDRVETNILGHRGSLGERVDDVGDVAVGHRLTDNLSRHIHSGRSDRREAFLLGSARISHHADVPQLRCDLASRGMDGVDHARPSRQRRAAVERRMRTGLRCRVVIDGRPLRNDQSHASFSATTVVRNNVVTGHATGRKPPRHWGHDDPVRQAKVVRFEGTEKHVGQVRHCLEFLEQVVGTIR